MKLLIVISLGLVLFLAGVMLSLKMRKKTEKRKQGDTIAKNLGEIEKEKEESHLSRRLFYKVKSSLFKMRP